MSTVAAKVTKTRKVSTAQRNYKAEAERAQAKLAIRVGAIAAARHDGSLGDEIIKLAQVAAVCSLPYSHTEERQITRSSRLGDGSYLRVTFTAMAGGTPLPYGRDRKLLAWILDRAIQGNSPFVPWTAATEYLREAGIAEGGKSNKELRERFDRIAGLGVHIQRDRQDGVRETSGYKVLGQSRLPKSISGTTIDATQTSLPGMEERFGVMLSLELFNDIREYNVVLPRFLWRGLTGSAQVQDITFWLYVRCYAAASETVIPWSAFQEQFGAMDSNPWRLKANIRKAVKVLSLLWAEVSLSEVQSGIQVDRAAKGLLQDDPKRGRTRRL